MKSFADYIQVPWNEHFVSLATGIRMAYCDCGPADGSPVILIHGVTDGRISWSQVAPMLADLGYRVYVPEYRGNGKTDKPDPGPGGYTVETHRDDMLALMDALGLQKAHIVGHSLGSLIAQLMNIKAPERILSTTLMESTVCCATSEVLQWAHDGDGTAYLGVRGYDAEQKMPESFLRTWTENTNESDDFQQATLEHVRQMPYPVWDWLITGLNAFDNRDGICKVSGRGLVLWGSKDEIFPAADQEALREGLTGCDATYETIEGGSHNVHWDSVRTRTEVVAILDKFMKSH